jgi:hypothetical protein
MRHFKEFFKFEANRFTCKRNLIVFIVLVVMMLIVTQFGINVYKERAAKKKEMLEFEKERMDGFISYRSYGSYGFRMALAPSPMNIFFINTAPFGDMTAVIDTSERLKVYNLLQSDSVFVVKAKWLSDVSVLLLLLGSLIAFLYGFEAYHQREYLKFLSSFSSSRRVFVNIALSRLLLLSLLVLVLMLLPYLLVIMNGIKLPLTWAMAAFYLETVVMMSGFFALGCWLGLSSSKVIALLLGLGIWMTAIIIPPLIIDMITNLKANTLTSVYKIEKQKFKILSNHEKRFLRKVGKVSIDSTPTDSQKKEIQFFEENDFPEIQALDEKIINEMKKNTSSFYRLSMLFPTTQYLSVNYEISSSGYLTLVDFYRIAKTTKADFMKKFIDIIYYKKKDSEKVEPFISGEKQLFFSEPQIVSTFFGGLLISILYFIGMMVGANRAYNKSLFRLEKGEEYGTNEEMLELESGRVASFNIIGDLFGRQLFNLMMGKGRYIADDDSKIRISLDGMDILENRERLDFHYFPHIRNIPGEIRAGALLSLLIALSNTGKEKRRQIFKGLESGIVMKRSLKEMNADELGKVFLAVLDIGTPAVYLLNDVIYNMTPNFAIALRDRLFAFADNENKLVVFLTGYQFVLSTREGVHSYVQGNHWLDKVAFFEKLEASEKSPAGNEKD